MADLGTEMILLSARSALIQAGSSQMEVEDIMAQHQDKEIIMDLGLWMDTDGWARFTLAMHRAGSAEEAYSMEDSQS